MGDEEEELSQHLEDVLDEKLLGKVGRMDPEDLMALMNNREAMQAALKSGDMSDPKLREMLRLLKENGLSYEDLDKLGAVSKDNVGKLLGKAEEGAQEKAKKEKDVGKLTVKDMKKLMAAQQAVKEAQLQLMNTLDKLQEAFHVDQVLDSLTEREKAVFDAFNQKRPKLLSKYLDFLIVRNNRVEKGLLQ